MPQIVADPLCRPVSTCFPDLESNNFNYLVLILSCFARGRAGASSREAPATRAATAGGDGSTTTA
jgi:hypothetical protein